MINSLSTAFLTIVTAAVFPAQALEVLLAAVLLFALVAGQAIENQSRQPMGL